MKTEYLPYIITAIVILLLSLPVYDKAVNEIITAYGNANWISVPALIICSILGMVALTFVVGVIIFLLFIFMAALSESEKEEQNKKDKYKEEIRENRENRNNRDN